MKRNLKSPALVASAAVSLGPKSGKGGLRIIPPRQSEQETICGSQWPLNQYELAILPMDEAPLDDGNAVKNPAGQTVWNQIASSDDAHFEIAS